MCLVDTNDSIQDYFLDKPRFIDKDEMPRRGTTEEIDWIETNKMWQKHVFLVTNLVKVNQIYDGYIVNADPFVWDTSHEMSMGITGANDYTSYGFAATGAPLAFWASPCQGPWFLKFAYQWGSDWWKLVGCYADRHLAQNFTNYLHLPLTDNGSQLQAIYGQMGPKWWDEY